MDKNERSDRVIATKWDAAFTLFDGVPAKQDIDRLQNEVPKQEFGRLSFKELTLSRANRSVRVFNHVVDSLSKGSQPDLNLLELRGNPLLAKDKRDIYFDFNKYVVKQEYMEVIQAHAKYLNETPAANMKIQGNTDYRGSHEYNLSLGQKRSVAVKEALNSFGVDDSQIETVSYRKEYANLDCVEQNSCGEDRRADIVYTVE